MLITFLSSDTLLWGCLALALIALFTISRVISKRRDARKANRKMRAQAQGLHAFLDAVRADHRTSAQGVWHYDFASGAQQYSDQFTRLVAGVESEIVPAIDAQQMLERSGVDLVMLARDNIEQSEPYEVHFTLRDEGTIARPMVLKACNLRNPKGEVQRMIAVINEALDEATDSAEK